MKNGFERSYWWQRSAVHLCEDTIIVNEHHDVFIE